ncbi:hypothetical protein [Corynebacterium variabile]|uniref:Uncharacterized protein n=1 Tax=Corynebacterium variabile TaxID=1727 RepID=A0A4Y4C7M9_9CORY|nr:hypothetical protein [Corynebacterium variabile]GEC87444.1 hypothetical protein CVA01_27580 [Corynebacterium variabile]
MAYEPTDWVDDAEPDLEAANLNKIEQGIKAAHDAAVAAQSTADGKADPDDIPTAPTADTLSGATTVGRAVVKAATESAARSAIGAGTSNLALGTTSATAAAGDHTHTVADVTGLQDALDGKVSTADFAAAIARIDALETPSGE